MNLRPVQIAIAMSLSLSIACGDSDSSLSPDSGPESADSGPGSADSGPGAADAGPDAPDALPPGTRWFDAPRSAAHIFVSGHSLIDRVFGWWPLVDGGPINGIAVSAGKDHHSLLQSGPGSTAQLRREDIVEGRDDTPSWGQFDTLIVLERSDFVSAMMHENGIEALGWFVDNIRNAAPGGDELFLYQTWWGNDGNPRVDIQSWDDWREHVRAELPLVECAAERIGRARNTHFRVIPAAIAIAALIDAAEAGEADGMQISDIWSEDLVHLSDTGHIFMSMIVFASTYRTPITGVTIPDLSANRTAAYARIVDRVVSNYYDSYRAPTAGQCRTAMQDMCSRFGDNSCDVQAYFSDALYGDPVGD